MNIRLRDRLLDLGIKPSLQRMAIMDFLIKNPIHPTADIIFNELYPSIPTLSKTTVYNTLKLLEEKGAINSILIDEKNIRYDANTVLHAHFQCKCCGKICDLWLEDTASFQPQNTAHLKIEDLQILYRGYCENCISEQE